MAPIKVIQYISLDHSRYNVLVQPRTLTNLTAYRSKAINSRKAETVHRHEYYKIQKGFCYEVFHKLHGCFHCAGVRLMLLSKGKGLHLHVRQAKRGCKYIALALLQPAPHSGRFTPGKTAGSIPQILKVVLVVA